MVLLIMYPVTTSCLNSCHNLKVQYQLIVWKVMQGHFWSNIKQFSTSPALYIKQTLTLWPMWGISQFLRLLVTETTAEVVDWAFRDSVYWRFYFAIQYSLKKNSKNPKLYSGEIGLLVRQKKIKSFPTWKTDWYYSPHLHWRMFNTLLTISSC